MDLEPRPPISKSFIQQRTTQEEIFRHYLGLEIQTTRHFCNPLRQDNRPTCNFWYSNGRLYFRDYAKTGPLDCFALVEEIYNCNFYKACVHIADDMNLREDETENTARKTEVDFQSAWKNVQESQSRTKIEVRRAPMTEGNKDYLKSHGVLPSSAKKYRCTGIDHLWLRGEHCWMRKPEDPALAYYFGTDDDGIQQWKIYFYKRDENRFLCNTSVIQGWEQLPPDGDLVVITKSLKDVMTLDSMGITAIAPQTESYPPTDETIEELKSRFSKVVSLYDFEYAGVRTANTLKRKHNVEPFFLTDGRFGSRDFGAKDISDYVKDYGRQNAYKLIERAKKHLQPVPIDQDNLHVRSERTHEMDAEEGRRLHDLRSLPEPPNWHTLEIHG